MGNRRTIRLAVKYKKMEPSASACIKYVRNYSETFQDIAYAGSFFMLAVSARSWQAVRKKHSVYKI